MCPEFYRFLGERVAIAHKLCDPRLRWFGQVLRADGDKESGLKDYQSNDGLTPYTVTSRRLGSIPDQAHDRALWRQRISKANLVAEREKR
ncbi:RNA polymerase factor sigma-70 domain protein [Ancylostoma caninum]|uniref:RNA polymerase factor sigma-70 domain protein n=1 Tax=Ancylostoma caninum TaxID=29170 RepID=A0A368FIL2_ANCCA|nr:RNA polymerase factor sigma-70 domain protein [Ancylostoma caninum]